MDLVLLFWDGQTKNVLIRSGNKLLQPKNKIEDQRNCRNRKENIMASGSQSNRETGCVVVFFSEPVNNGSGNHIGSVEH